MVKQIQVRHHKHHEQSPAFRQNSSHKLRKKISEKNMLLARSTELLSEAQKKPHFRCSARRANIVSFELNFFFLA